MTGEFAGTLTQKVVVERQQSERTATGVAAGEWVPSFSCRAAIHPDGAGQEREAMSFSAMPRLRVTIRSRRGLTIDQRIRWGTRLLAIRQIIDDPRSTLR